MRKHDWADELARQIAADFGSRPWTYDGNVEVPDELSLNLVAARLRIIRHEGVGDGLDQARDAIRQPPKGDTE
jgi:hypothetical protein